MAVRTISDAGGNWNDTAAWVEGAVPTNADDVVATATSGNLTLNVNGYCRSIDFTGYTGTFNMSGYDLGIGNLSDQPASKLLLKLVTGMTLTINSSSSFSFRSDLTGNKITTAGKSMPLTYFGAVDTTSGEYLLQDNYTTVYTIQLNSGTIDANDYDVTCNNFIGYLSGLPVVRGIKMGSGTWTLTGNNMIVWDCSTTTNLTFNCETSTIVVSDTGSNYKILNFGSGLTIYNLSITAGGTGYVGLATGTGSGSVTFNNLTINAPKEVRFYYSTTYTINGTFSATGSSGNIITLKSSSDGSYYTLSKSSGSVVCDYLDIKDSHVGGGATWTPGIHSFDAGGNSGWFSGNLSLQVAANADDIRGDSESEANLDDERIAIWADSDFYTHCAARFDNITIPKGANITSAFLILRCRYDDSSGALSPNLRAYDEDDTAGFTAGASGWTDIEGRAVTTANASWNIGNILSGGWYVSADIKDVIKEIVDRAGWSSGNAIGISIKTATQVSYIVKDFSQYNEGASYAPKIIINYTVPSTDERDMSVMGRAQSSSERNARVFGKVVTGSERSAETFGAERATSERDLSTEGISSEDTVTDERDMSVGGREYATSPRNMSVEGRGSGTDAGSNRNASTFGKQQSNSVRNMSVEGRGAGTQSTNERNSVIHGQDSEDDTRHMSIEGFLGTHQNSERNMSINAEEEDISNYIGPNKPCRISLGFEDEFLQVFDGKTQYPESDKKSISTKIHIDDKIKAINEYRLPQGSLLTNIRTDEYIALILQEMGYDESDYSLDAGIQQMALAWFAGNTAGYEIQQAVEAEGGRFYQREDGILVFENRQHYNVNEEHQNSVMEFDFSNLEDLDYPDDRSSIVNHLVIKLKPRNQQSLAEVWSYGSVPVYMGPGQTITVWATFTDPVSPITTPVATTDYTANTKSEGSGVDKTADISITTTKFAQAAKLEIRNTGTAYIYLTMMKLRGQAWTQSDTIEIEEKDDTSITNYGTFKKEIENKYMTDEDYVGTLAETIVDRYANPTHRVILKNRCVPQLQLGDMIGVHNEEKGEYYLMRIVKLKTIFSLSSGMEQDIYARQVTTDELADYFTIGVSDIGGDDIIAP